MAATVALLGSTFTTTAGNKTVTATPTLNDLIVIIAASTGVSTSAITDNNADAGGSYTQIGTAKTGFSTTGNLQVFVRNNLVGSATSTAFSAAQTSSTGGGLLVYRVTGMSLTGSAAVRSSGGQSTGTAGTTPAPVLSLTPLSSNPIISAVANAATVAGSVLVQRAGYSEDFDNIYSTPPTGLEASHLASGETSATLTQGGTSGTAFASVAIELQFNTAPTTALNTPADTATGQSTTPTLNFTGTDADSDTLEYEVQIYLNSNFGLDQSQVLSGSGSIGLSGSGFNPSALGQSFTPALTGNLYQVILFLKKTGTPTDNLTVEVHSSSQTGTLLATSNSIASSVLTTSLAEITFNFSSPAFLTASTQYFLILNRATGDSTNFPSWAFQLSSGYSGGDASEVISSSWNTLSDRDFYFKTYMNVLDKLSTADAGFTAGHPFASGVAKDFTVQAGDILTANTTYYWCVRAIDPLGTNTYGAFATPRSFRTAAAVTSIPNKIYSILQAINRSNSY